MISSTQTLKVSNTILLLLPFLLLLNSCGGKEEAKAPEGMCSIELQSYGKPFAVFVPDTSNNPLIITEEASGALLVKAGKNFAISIFEEKADLALKKEDIKADEVNKFTSFVNDEPDAIFWESSITEPEFHFLINNTINNRDFSFQDLQDPENKLFSKAAVQKMFESCKSIKELPNKD